MASTRISKSFDISMGRSSANRKGTDRDSSYKIIAPTQYYYEKKNYDLTLHQYFNLSSIAIPESPDRHKEVWEYALDNKQLAYTQSGTNGEQLQDHHRHYSQDHK